MNYLRIKKENKFIIVLKSSMEALFTNNFNKICKAICCFDAL